MKMIQLTEPPDDCQSYTTLIGECPTPDWIHNLCELLKRGSAIHIEAGRFETIKQIEQILNEHCYGVMFIKFPTETAFARFFLKRMK